ncbi:transposase [Turneriella parva]|uniref:Transposase IS200-like domain-containing protein n=1 Tax=Turneriella parva (strain ATCC BAA-1111 / DSM 21527 / NCTC 11395 / H) TaxID=869212 RepID=I4B787_TURPD|nr:transposase [Turneriella parva]AFM13144.1 hypothetical protein Turpa_2504 [Turneriella parva DSM 21527]
MLRRNRKSIRLKGYDYSQPGHYFITICTHQRAHLFGGVRGGKMVLNAMGSVADACWQAIPNHYPHVRLDEFVIMPNHVHGVVVIDGDDAVPQTNAVGAKTDVVGAKTDVVGAQTDVVGAQNFVPLRVSGKSAQFGKIISRSISTIVRGFKTGVTKWARNNTDQHIIWQRNYYEHIVRDADALHRIRQYIRNNPSQWINDDNFHIDRFDVPV